MSKKKPAPLKSLDDLPPGDPAATNEAPPDSSGERSPELSGIEGKGVSHVKIPAIVKKINRYEGVKDARVAATVKEVEAKTDLFAELHAHADELPRNANGFRFYRHDDGDGPVDWILEEKLKRRGADDGSDD